MSVPAVGQYVIYNTIPGQFGEKLAVTFHGVAQSLIVDTLAPNNNQQLWSVEEAESINQRALRPINALDRQASWRDDQAVAVSPAHAFAWIITGDDNGYTILDGGSTAEWRPINRGGAQINMAGLNGGAPTQKWIFEKKA